MTETTERSGRLEGKTVLVTGAAQGIGFSTAVRAVKEGAIVYIGDLQADKGEEAAAAAGASFVPLNVTDEASVKAAVDGIIAEHGRLDVLINNAGVVRLHNATDTTKEDWDATMAVDLEGLWKVTQEVGAHMRSAGNGAIVNVASVSALIAMSPEPLFAYAIAKAGVAQLTRSLAVEWAPYGIRTNAISPGRIDSPMLRDNAPKEWVDLMVSQSPQKRLIEPEEIAAAIVFLASDDASAINGHNLVADTGLVVQ